MVKAGRGAAGRIHVLHSSTVSSRELLTLSIFVGTRSYLSMVLVLGSISSPAPRYICCNVRLLFFIQLLRSAAMVNDQHPYIDILYRYLVLGCAVRQCVVGGVSPRFPPGERDGRLHLSRAKRATKRAHRRERDGQSSTVLTDVPGYACDKSSACQKSSCVKGAKLYCGCFMASTAVFQLWVLLLLLLLFSHDHKNLVRSSKTS